MKIKLLDFTITADVSKEHQTTINNENRIIKLEQKITELQYRINDMATARRSVRLKNTKIISGIIN